MAALHTSNTVLPSASQGIVEVNPQGQKYPPRSYQPYVFQPNFLKQQIRQRELEKANRLGQVEENAGKFGPLGGHLPSSASAASSLQTNVAEEVGRKKSGRKVIDWTPSCTLYLERRRWQRPFTDVPALLPDPSYSIEMQAPMAYRQSSASSVATKFVRSATNKMKCPVYKVVWTPDGRRLVTGSASGEFTLWNGTAFNFETILQAHDSPVRAMSWSHNDSWLITGDNQGYIKYWQLNMNNVKMYQAHKDQACRSVCFGPTDSKFVTASDDGTVRVWDFLRCHEEHILRGHGSDVKQVDWHPQKSLLVSASKDLQTPVKLWDPKSGQSLATIHAHKGTVMDVKFNRNGNWFLSASRDHLVKLYDIRNLKEEIQVFRGHKKEAFSVAWHPIHEDMFASGGSEGSIIYWQVGEEKELGGLEGAHDSLIWSLAWHPLGHILVSGSNDHSTKFWTRNRPGDSMRDKYNLFPNPEDTTMKTTLTSNQEEMSIMSHIPGMGDADAAAADVAKREEEDLKVGIPGLDWSFEEKSEFQRKMVLQQDNRKKIPFSRPVPRTFAAAWESKKEGAPRRQWSRSPSPPRREQFDEPPPWHRDERPPPRFRHRPPTSWHHPMGDLPPRGPLVDDRRPPEFHPGHVPPGHESYLDLRLQGSDRRPPPPRMDFPPHANLHPLNHDIPVEDRHYLNHPEEFLSPNHRDREFDNLGPEDSILPLTHRPPHLQHVSPGPILDQPQINFPHDQENIDSEWNGKFDQEPPFEGDRHPPIDGHFHQETLYEPNLNHNTNEYNYEGEMAFSEQSVPMNHHSDRGIMRGRPRGGFMGRPPLRGRGRRGGPRFPGPPDALSNRGRWPPTRSNGPIRMRRGGRRP